MCTARMVSMGASCGSPSPLYASTVPGDISRTQLINTGKWETHAQVHDEEERAARGQLHHFS